MSTFTHVPSVGVNLSAKFKVRKSEFGGGYQQRVGDGINTIARSWSVSFSNDATTIDTIQAFLDNDKGIASFTWVPPVGVSGKFICEGYSRSISDYDSETLTATFNEVFGE